MMPQRVRVTASASYEVVIGENLDAGALFKEVHAPCRVVLVSDDNVFPLYGQKTMDSLQAMGFEPTPYVIPSGEQSKTMDTVNALLEFLAEKHLTNTDLLVALGGGVIGDLTGFTAAIYRRGMGVVQMPTTLLAAVDASVGGKTAVDLKAGKNLAGAFHQPLGVFCDTATFSTLPPSVFADGMAEVIKYGIIQDAELFEALETGAQDISDICARCVAIKARIVEVDEFDTGLRRLLNFGHTLGHGIEALSDFAISHGQAVAMGMMAITQAAEKEGLVAEPFAPRLKALLEKYNLPTVSPYGAQELAAMAMSDKKRAGSKLHVVLPGKIGSAYVKPMAMDAFEALIGGVL